jgi:ATP-dependent DNA helicase RecG
MKCVLFLKNVLLLVVISTWPIQKLNCWSEHEKKASAMQPVYPSTETLTNRGITNRVINKLMQQLFHETHTLFTETLPAKKSLMNKINSKKCCFIQHSLPK